MMARVCGPNNDGKWKESNGHVYLDDEKGGILDTAEVRLRGRAEDAGFVVQTKERVPL